MTVGVDSDRVMVLIKEASHKQGIAYLLLLPYSYMLNKVEGAVNCLKVGVASVLLSACTTTSPLTIHNVTQQLCTYAFMHAARPWKPMAAEHGL